LSSNGPIDLLAAGLVMNPNCSPKVRSLIRSGGAPSHWLDRLEHRAKPERWAVAVGGRPRSGSTSALDSREGSRSYLDAFAQPGFGGYPGTILAMRKYVVPGATQPASWPYPDYRLDQPLQFEVEPGTGDLPDPPEAP